jgi:SAM-dependent methyltransferase
LSPEQGSADRPGEERSTLSPEGGPDASPSSPGPTREDGSYLARVMDEIDAEVRARRAAGEFPPSFERRLDLMFARFTPVGVHEGHFDETLRLADRSAYIDIEVPVRSEKPGLGFVKRVLRRLMAWYLNYVVQQLTHFTSATMRVLHMVDERLDALEQQAEADRPASPLLEGVAAEEEDLSRWAPLVLAHLGKVDGRVLHAECGRGALLSELAGSGVDVYGVDPRAELLDDAARRGLEVRRADALDHLRNVSRSGLAGLLLSGCVDRLALRSQRALVEMAADKLRPGGRLVILGASPNAWSRRSSPLQADLAPGKPLHPDTWSHLLAAAGFSSLRCEWSEEGQHLDRLPAGAEGADVINSDLERLEELLLGPEAYAVTCVRGG